MEIGIHADGILAWTRERSRNLSHGEALTCNLGIKGLFFGDGRIWNDLEVGFERSFLFFFFLSSDEKFRDEIKEISGCTLRK